MSKRSILLLNRKAFETRREILNMIVKARGTHIASAFSIVEVIVYLYEEILKVNPSKPKDPRRDKFVLSKGHGCAALYVTLANKGFFSKKELGKYCSENGILGGHPDSLRIPGVETSTGSLGHGMPVAVGFALANKIDGISSRVYCVIGDGESNEGSIWEATQIAAHHKLDNLTVILDENKLMISGFAKDILDPLAFSDKFRSFGWHVIPVDGHSFLDLSKAFEKAKKKKGKPTIIIADTIKGKGVSFMENKKEWYSKLPSDSELSSALSELDTEISKINKELKR